MQSREKDRAGGRKIGGRDGCNDRKGERGREGEGERGRERGMEVGSTHVPER